MIRSRVGGLEDGEREGAIRGRRALSLGALDLAEGSTVEVSIIPAAWSEKLRSVLERVRARTEPMSPEEIEAEITRAADEVRDERLAAP